MTSLKLLSLFALFLTSLNSHASVVCPERYPNGNTLSYSDGTINYPNGNRLRYSDGTMNYANGNRLRYSDGTMNYPNGNRLRYSDGTMNYENGNRLRYSDGTLRDKNGNSVPEGTAIRTSVAAGDAMQLNVRASKTDSSYILSLSEDKWSLLISFDDAGNVTCDLENTGSPDPAQSFTIVKPSASVRVDVNAGYDAAKIKKAIESALNSL